MNERKYSDGDLTTFGRAAKRVGMTFEAVEGLAQRGVIEFVEVPGGARLVRPRDLAEVIRAGTRPATRPLPQQPR